MNLTCRGQRSDEVENSAGGNTHPHQYTVNLRTIRAAVLVFPEEVREFGVGLLFTSMFSIPFGFHRGKDTTEAKLPSSLWVEGSLSILVVLPLPFLGPYDNSRPRRMGSSRSTHTDID